MAFPDGVRTRTVVLRAPVLPIDGVDLRVRTTITPSRHLIWGRRFVPTPLEKFTSPTGPTGDAQYECVVTDMEGMRDENGRVIDISGGEATHVYRARMVFVAPNGRDLPVPPLEFAFVVPTDDAPLDLDATVSVEIVEGIPLAYPDQVAAALSAAGWDQGLANDAIVASLDAMQAASDAADHREAVEAVVATNDGIMAAALGDQSGTSSTLLATAHAERYAALMGVQAGTGADQTAALQAAINAAGALKVALVLPAGVIRVDGQITLPRDWVSIRGSHMSILDWSNASFSGPAIRGAVGAGGIIPVPAYGVGSSRIENVSLRGPQSTGTEVDGLSLETPSTYTGRFVLDRVHFVGFRHQEIIGSGSYLHKHFSCTYARAQQTAVYFAGTSDSGENVSWSGCIFYNMNSSHPDATFLRGVQASAGEAYFSHCSFDYGKRTLVADSGTWDFAQCHIESDFNTAPWFSISSPTGATRPTVLAFHGGQIMPHDTVDGSPSVAGAHFLAIGVDEPARGVSSVIPVRVVLEGVEFQPKIRNCTLLRNFGTRTPLVTGSPVPFPFVLLGISGIKDPLFARAGSFDDVIATAANLPAQPLDYQAGRGWQTSAWVKTNFALSLDESSDSGGRSLKIAPTANVSQWVVSQCIPCRPGGVIHVAMSYRIPGAWTGQLAPRIRFWDAVGAQISETTWYTINNSTMDTDPGYRIIADQRSIPDGAAYITVALWATVTGGEVAYIDALELMPL